MCIIVKEVSKFSNRTDRRGEVFKEFTAGLRFSPHLRSIGLQHMLQNSGGQVRGLAEWTGTLPSTMVGHEPT